MKVKRLHKLFALLLVCGFCVITATACNPSETKYNEAFELLEKCDYAGAYAIFTELGDYKDAAKMASRFHYTPESSTDKYVDIDGEKTYTNTNTFNENNLIITSVYALPDGYQHTCNFTYNESGKLTKMFCTDTDGLEECTEREYDENGNKVREVNSYDDGTVYTYAYTYNEDGYLATMLATVPEDSAYLYEYTYNERGDQITCVVTSGDMVVTYESIYDAEGKKIEETRTYGDETTGSNTLYTYDEKGRLVLETRMVMGVESSVYEYVYDDNDRLIREKCDYGDGVYLAYEYTYDNNGNLIKGYRDDSDIGERTSEIAYKLVYVPYDYTAEEWQDIIDFIIGW